MLSTLKFMLDRASAEAWQVIVSIALSLLLPALAALALWPAGRAAYGLSMLKGFGLFWVVVLVVYVLATWVQGRLRVDLYSHPDAFVGSNLLVSGLLMLGWTACAALLAREAAAGVGLWAACALYLFGLLSGIVACQVLGSFYSGQLYKLACLILACVGFALFAFWPAPARAAFGWLF
ncbi:MAG TPA: hypothetical protein VF297_24890 [Pyrinomonadaceae bacterium]